MFTQNPHPIYNALLENSYEITKEDLTKNIKWYKLNCKNYKVRLGLENGSVHVTDYSDSNNLKYTILPSGISIYNNNEDDNDKDKDIYYTIKHLIVSLQKSTDTKNIQIIKFIICEIMRIHPDITDIYFSPISRNENTNLKFVDQKRRLIEIESKDIKDLFYDFYFINDLKLGCHLNLDLISNHNLIEIYEKSYQIKELLNLEIKTKIIK